jgi:hypothetical protein
MRTDDDEPEVERNGRRSGSPGRPWTRVLLAAAIGGPALCIGGAPPWVVPLFCVLVGAAWVRLCLRVDAPLRPPVAAGLGVLVAATTLVQWLPLADLRARMAPGLHAMVSDALAYPGLDAGGITPVAGDTGLECARLVGLTALFVLAAQLSWRSTAAIVAGTGAAVAVIGFAHEAAGVDAIYGVYHARDVDLAGIPALLGTFVNANHQSGLLLLGIFAAAALANDQHSLGLGTRDPSKVDRYGDRFLAAMGAVIVQVIALVLSLSRGAIVSFLLLAPLALMIALRRPRNARRDQGRRSRRLSPVRLLVGAGVAGLALLVAQHAAWRELATLADVADVGAIEGTKLHQAVEALGLVGLSPVVGVGRGAMIDLFPTVDTRPSYLTVTHVECMPATAIVEWGPFVGGLFLVGTLLWWINAWRCARDRADRDARRVALLGLLALALQSTFDFSLEFLGVAAPAVALAGALSAAPAGAGWHNRRALWIGAGVLGGAAMLAAASAPATWSRRHDRDLEIRAGTRDAAAELRSRPLDGRLHGAIARVAADDGDWERALAHARSATLLRPGAIDGWLLRAAAERAVLADADAADRALARGLDLLHDPPAPELVDWILRDHPQPRDLIAIAPRQAHAWRLLVEALTVRAPAHADAMAEARADALPHDPEPLRVRVSLALRAGNPALALHHARLLRQRAPNGAASHLAVVQALRAFGPPREAEARDALLAAIDGGGFVDLAERGLLEEELIASLLALGSDDDLARARALAPELLRRPATREGRRRREARVKQLDQR